jgi:hypothetical protein
MSNVQNLVSAEMGYCPVCADGAIGSCDERCELRVSELRASIVRLGAREYQSDRMFAAAQRVMDRDWRAIEAIVKRDLLSLPNDPSQPMRLR